MERVYGRPVWQVARQASWGRMDCPVTTQVLQKGVRALVLPRGFHWGPLPVFLGPLAQADLLLCTRVQQLYKL
jgi:hypothetical protein